MAEEKYPKGYVHERERIVNELKAVYCDMACKRMDRDLDRIYERIVTLQDQSKLPVIDIPIIEDPKPYDG